MPVAGKDFPSVPSERMLPLGMDTRILPSTKSCFVCGQLNPAGLKLRFETDGSKVYARFTPKPEHAGYRGTAHGGILATVLDEVMAWACIAATRRLAVCAEFTVRFALPALTGSPLMAIGSMTNNRRNRLFETEAELRDEQDRAVAVATGKYIPVKDAESATMLEDMEGGAEALRRLETTEF